MTSRIFTCALCFCHVAWSTKWCDKNQTALHREGLIGDRGVLPWLGVLRVHIHNRNKFSVAVTGIVLVKENYAIASAQDVDRLPRNHIIADGKAMFIVGDHQQWYCGVDQISVHPDYGFNTFNSIALLRLRNGSAIPAICWMSSFDSSKQLYAMGYTDRNKLLEKVVYKIRHVESDLCGEYYNRVGFKHLLNDEQEYVCGSARTNNDHCDWDSGMVLATNATGYWQLVGLGVRSPGCAAPARFISTHRYVAWIESIIDLDRPLYNRYIFK